MIHHMVSLAFSGFRSWRGHSLHLTLTLEALSDAAATASMGSHAYRVVDMAPGVPRHASAAGPPAVGASFGAVRVAVGLAPDLFRRLASAVQEGRPDPTGGGGVDDDDDAGGGSGGGGGGVPKVIQVQVVPILFTQGVNEMQSVVSTLGSAACQQQVNNASLVSTRPDRLAG